LARLLTLFVLFWALLFAQTPSEYPDRLLRFLDGKSFQINGDFYQYDFERDGFQRNDWIYIDRGSQKAFRLLGREPSAANPFGWEPLASLPADLDRTRPTGHFIFIDFPLDSQLFQNNAFSWLYVYPAKEMVFKLMGASAEGNFVYLDTNGDQRPDPLPLSYQIDGDTILFKAHVQTEAFMPPTRPDLPPTPCEDRLTTQRQGVSYSVLSRSSYQGEIAYDCSIAKRYHWVLARPSLTIANVQLVRKIRIHTASEEVDATITYDYRTGEEHFQGSYNGNGYDCTSFYKAPPLPVELSNNPARLEEFFNAQWANNCTGQLLSTTCPAQLVECRSANAIDTSRPGSISIQNNYRIEDIEGRIHRVETKQRIDFRP